MMHLKILVITGGLVLLSVVTVNAMTSDPAYYNQVPPNPNDGVLIPRRNYIDQRRMNYVTTPTTRRYDGRRHYDMDVDRNGRQLRYRNSDGDRRYGNDGDEIASRRDQLRYYPSDRRGNGRVGMGDGYEDEVKDNYYKIEPERVNAYRPSAPYYPVDDDSERRYPNRGYADMGRAPLQSRGRLGSRYGVPQLGASQLGDPQLGAHQLGTSQLGYSGIHPLLGTIQK